MDSLLSSLSAGKHYCIITAVPFLFLFLFSYIYLRWFYVDFPFPIANIPQVSGGTLLAGNYYQLGVDQATTAEKWARQNGWPLFQMRMGTKRVVMITSFEAAREWIVTNQTATIDRPYIPTFHALVSSTSAATIGTSPWNERTKKQRRVVGSLTTGPATRKFAPVLDFETRAMVSDMFKHSKRGEIELSPHIYQKRLALNIVTMFCYDMRFDSIDDPLLHRILRDANQIASFRSTSANAHDYIPHLRLFSKKKRTAIEVRSRRDIWLANMLNKVRESIKSGESRPCVAEGLLKDTDEKLTKQDIKTILGGLMSGGFETLFSTSIIGIGFLASTKGQEIQKRAYEDLLAVYSSAQEAFDKCLIEEKSSYLVAFVRETLRFYPPLKVLPARQTYKEFVYNDVVVPRGVSVYINAQAINRDPSHYGPTASEFDPTRFLPSVSASSHHLPDETTMKFPHLSYGAGSRACTAINFSNRILYATFARLLLVFRLREAEEECDKAETDYILYKEGDGAASTALPKRFKVGLEVREDSEIWAVGQQGS